MRTKFCRSCPHHTEVRTGKMLGVKRVCIECVHSQRADGPKAGSGWVGRTAVYFISELIGILALEPSDHYMYRTVVTICIAQLSLYVPHSGHYMYHTVVTICTAQ